MLSDRLGDMKDAFRDGFALKKSRQVPVQASTLAFEEPNEATPHTRWHCLHERIVTRFQTGWGA